jgi:hypothetical protein
VLRVAQHRAFELAHCLVWKVDRTTLLSATSTAAAGLVCIQMKKKHIWTELRHCWLTCLQLTWQCMHVPMSAVLCAVTCRSTRHDGSSPCCARREMKWQVSNSGSCRKLCSSRIAGVLCVQRQTREACASPLGDGVRVRVGRDVREMCGFRLPTICVRSASGGKADNTGLQHRIFLALGG